jgi:hypothetical protein
MATVKKVKKYQSGGQNSKMIKDAVKATTDVVVKGSGFGVVPNVLKSLNKGKPIVKKGTLKSKNGSSTPAWQRKEGKNPSGGLNAKGRASYNRANPGKPGLKAPQPQGGPRKKSFCARMSGMKSKLTSSKTANDPNSRINKSLRKWKC